MRQIGLVWMGLLALGCGKGDASEAKPGAAVARAGAGRQAVADVAAATGKTRDSIVGLQNALLELREAGFLNGTASGRLGAVVVDPLEVGLAIRAAATGLEPSLAEDLVAVAFESKQLERRRKEVVAAFARDAKELAAAKARRQAARPTGDPPPYAGYRYAVVLQLPAEGKPQPPGAQIVELGRPLCAGRAVDGPCQGEPLTGFRYRGAVDGPWRGLDVAPLEPGGAAIPTERLIPIVANGVFQQLVVGSQASASEILLLRQLEELAEQTEELVVMATALEKQLMAAAGPPASGK